MMIRRIQFERRTFGFLSAQEWIVGIVSTGYFMLGSAAHDSVSEYSIVNIQSWRLYNTEPKNILPFMRIVIRWLYLNSCWLAVYVCYRRRKDKILDQEAQNLILSKSIILIDFTLAFQLTKQIPTSLSTRVSINQHGMLLQPPGTATAQAV
ncbi:Small nuclear ribonucleoprotein G [Fusarium oxysporum f. sp. albedinis]|nr:Small nuclear ribonucleoprotein G [Fusarium oxysporum f. sp. albedinis]